MIDGVREFWSLTAAELLEGLGSALNGLSSAESAQRLGAYGPNLLKEKERSDSLRLFLSQFRSPLTLVLIFAACLALVLRDTTNALIVLSIVLVSSVLGFAQERSASNAVRKLLAMIKLQANVLRDGKAVHVPAEEVVPGDVVLLEAGDAVPGDSLILESKDLFADEATLTGETFPIEKAAGVATRETELSARTNSLWKGTHVVSGTATALVVRTGRDTEFGAIYERLRLRPPEADFERGVRRFGYFLMEVTLILVIAIFAVNVYLQRPVLNSFLFSLALAVGLTPQLLPAIISVNLSHGARRMARSKVIVRRLASIENFGSMNVLCSDKTGTLTEGVVHLHEATDVDGRASQKVLLYAYLNAVYETGYRNPIDEAIRAHSSPDITPYRKLDEIPYDFIRKRLSVLVAQGERRLIITKGALPNVLEACSSAEGADSRVVPLADARNRIDRRARDLGDGGYRMLGVAYRDIGAASRMRKEDEAGMTFLGMLVFFDEPKRDIAETVGSLGKLGLGLKMITGDNRAVAAHMSKQLGNLDPTIVTGREMRSMSDEALVALAGDVDVFAEVEPNQKERIITALKKAGNVVGFMGDGINDASALRAADVGISVDGAADVAKEAADIVLLEKDLGVLVRGVQEGRTTFANTLKYVFMATSANFGNMFSMAGASLLIPFLPLLPKQILLTNLMTDFPEMTIARDSVDPELVERPRRWNIKFIRTFMVVFGLVSSVFDYLTFGVLLFLLRAGEAEFRTGWFIESVVSASLIVLVIRSRRPFFMSLPGRPLLLATALVVVATLALPFTRLAGLFGFTPLPVSFIALVGAIVAFYVVAAEIAKKVFYRHVEY